MKVLFVPQDANPYQELLRAALSAEGVTVRYLDGPTRSHTLNLALVPLTLLARRAQGYEVLHIHWVWWFSLPWLRRSNLARLVMQCWFTLFLGMAEVLRYRIVWTAHNVLPHNPVFHDDRAGRRRLARAASVVIVHSPATEPVVRRFGARDVRVVPHGSYVGTYPEPPERDTARQALGVDRSARVVAHVGTMRPYKGTDRLLCALRRPEARPLFALVAGACPELAYRQRLDHLAEAVGSRVVFRPGTLTDAQLALYLGAADAAVFPFRGITTSGSVLLALSLGVPVVIPDLPEFADIPASAAIRFVNDEDGLEQALATVARAPEQELIRMAAAAHAEAVRRPWSSVASATAACYRRPA